MSFLFYFISL